MRLWGNYLVWVISFVCVDYLFCYPCLDGVFSENTFVRMNVCLLKGPSPLCCFFIIRSSKSTLLLLAVVSLNILLLLLVFLFLSNSCLAGNFFAEWDLLLSARGSLLWEIDGSMAFWMTIGSTIIFSWLLILILGWTSWMEGWLLMRSDLSTIFRSLFAWVETVCRFTLITLFRL